MDMEKFKPKNATQKWGFGIILFSLFGVFTGIFAAIGAQDLTMLAMSVFYAGVAAAGFYLLLNEKPSLYFAQLQQKKDAETERRIQAALSALRDATGVRAVLALEELEALVRKANKKDFGPRMQALLSGIGFDNSRVDSKFLGAVNSRAMAPIVGFISSGQVRVYRDWVIEGKIGYDFDVSTRGDVTVDGSISYDKNNKPVDNRRATLHLATQEWSHSFSIDPNQADEARRILMQLNAIVEQMKPQALSAADLHAAMDKLMANSGKSPAEKLEELSNLRYQRLLSDQEFEVAKSKILGI
jgi:hypothetical protein